MRVRLRDTTGRRQVVDDGAAVSGGDASRRYRLSVWFPVRAVHPHLWQPSAVCCRAVDILAQVLHPYCVQMSELPAIFNDLRNTFPFQSARVCSQGLHATASSGLRGRFSPHPDGKNRKYENRVYVFLFCVFSSSENRSPNVKNRSPNVKLTTSSIDRSTCVRGSVWLGRGTGSETIFSASVACGVERVCTGT